LKTISKNLIRFTVCENVDNFHKKLWELINFANNWDNLKKSIDDVYKIDNFYNTEDDKEDNEITSVSNCTSYKNCVCCCLKLLINYNLYSIAYEHLCLAYKYLLTLPVTQRACEAILHIKNRLINTISNDNLEALMLMAVEKRKSLDDDMLINAIGDISEVLKKQLIGWKMFSYISYYILNIL